MTPKRFRNSGFGSDLTDLTDIQLSNILTTASTLVNVHCSVPMTPAAHDFRGGTVTNEQHLWMLPDVTFMDKRSRRIYPLHEPVATITSFVVKFTNTYQITIDPANIYVNSVQNWAEIVSIAAIVSGVYPVGINFGLYTPVAEVSYTYGWNYQVVGEILDLEDVGTYAADNQFWKASPAPVIYKNGAVQSSGFTIDLTEGTVEFAVAPDGTDIITADYVHPLPPAIAEATAIVATRATTESQLVAAGLGGLNEITIEEMTLRRSASRGGGSTVSMAVNLFDTYTAALLEPYNYTTVRG
jgi:hypothetical protein